MKSKSKITKGFVRRLMGIGLLAIGLATLLPGEAAAQTIRVAVFQDPAVSSADAAGNVVNQLNDSTFFDFDAAHVEQPEDLLAQLSSYDVVVIGGDGHHESIDNVNAVATQLKAWVQAGGRVVATGWEVYEMAFGPPFNTHPDFLAIMPVSGNQFLTQDTTLTITSVTGIATDINTFNYGNWLNWGAPKDGATVLGITGQIAGQGAIVTWQVELGTVTYLAPLYMGSRSTYGSTLDSLRCCDPDRLLEQAVANAPAPIPDTTPPETTITSVVDGNGAFVARGGSTLSSSITFTFGGTDAVGVAGFQCSLDGAVYAPCASPVGYSALAIGNHTFHVRTLDTAGNVDPTPASFAWTAVTPDQAIQNLITAIGNMGLSAGVANSLSARLNNINPNNKAAACGKLNAFINQVNAKVPPLTGAQATQLLQAANAIKASLGC